MTDFENDARDYGQDLIDASQRWSKSQWEPEIGRLNQKIDELQRANARQAVMAALDTDPELAGKWRTLNNDPGFLAWLDGIDGLSGVPRLQLLRRAFEAGHAAPVLAIFRAFTAGQLPARQRTPERRPYESGNPAPRIADTGPRVWTRAEITQFYEDRRHGRYDGREAEALRIERDIVAAARERRVKNPPLRMPNDP